MTKYPLFRTPKHPQRTIQCRGWRLPTSRPNKSVGDTIQSLPCARGGGNQRLTEGLLPIKCDPVTPYLFTLTSYLLHKKRPLSESFSLKTNLHSIQGFALQPCATFSGIFPSFPPPWKAQTPCRQPFCPFYPQSPPTYRLR